MPKRPVPISIPVIESDHAERIRALERLGTPPDAKVIVPGECMEMPGEGTPDEPYRMQPQIDPDAINQLTCTPLGLFVGGSQVVGWDAVVDGTAVADDPDGRLFTTVSGACIYLANTIGIASAAIFVRNDYSGTTSLSYVETADFASPRTVHLFCGRGGLDQPSGADEDGVDWNLDNYRPISNVGGLCNFIIHDLAVFRFAGTTSGQTFDSLHLYNTRCIWEGGWGNRIATRFIAVDSAIDIIGTTNMVDAGGFSQYENVDFCVRSAAGIGATITFGGAACYFQGNLFCGSASGTHGVSLPGDFDFIVRVGAFNRSGISTVASPLTINIPSGAEGRFWNADMGFAPGSLIISAPTTPARLDLRGSFDDVTVGSYNTLLMDVTCADLTVSAPAAAQLPGQVSARVVETADITGPANIDLGMGPAGNVILRGKGVVGDVTSRGSTLAAGTFLDCIGLDMGNIQVGGDPAGTSGTTKSYALDAGSDKTIITFAGDSGWPVAGTDAGTGNLVTVT